MEKFRFTFYVFFEQCQVPSGNFVTICYILKPWPMEIVDLCWFTELEDGDSPVRYVNVYQRVSYRIPSHGLLLYGGAINLIWRAWSSGWSISKRRCGSSVIGSQLVNGHATGSDWLEVPTIYKAYFSGLCKGISSENMALYGTNVPPSVGSWRSPIELA